METPLWQASYVGDARIVGALLADERLGVYLNFPAVDGTTPLYIASWKGHADAPSDLARGSGLGYPQGHVAPRTDGGGIRPGGMAGRHRAGYRGTPRPAAEQRPEVCHTPMEHYAVVRCFRAVQVVRSVS